MGVSVVAPAFSLVINRMLNDDYNRSDDLLWSVCVGIMIGMCVGGVALMVCGAMWWEDADVYTFRRTHGLCVRCGDAMRRCACVSRVWRGDSREERGLMPQGDRAKIRHYKRLAVSAAAIGVGLISLSGCLLAAWFFEAMSRSLGYINHPGTSPEVAPSYLAVVLVGVMVLGVVSLFVALVSWCRWCDLGSEQADASESDIADPMEL